MNIFKHFYLAAAIILAASIICTVLAAFDICSYRLTFLLYIYGVSVAAVKFCGKTRALKGFIASCFNLIFFAIFFVDMAIDKVLVPPLEGFGFIYFVWLYLILESALTVSDWAKNKLSFNKGMLSALTSFPVVGAVSSGLYLAGIPEWIPMAALEIQCIIMFLEIMRYNGKSVNSHN